MNEQNETGFEKKNRCPVEGCDWWVPEGMEHLYPDHKAEHESALPGWYFDINRWIGWQKTRLQIWWDSIQ